MIWGYMHDVVVVFSQKTVRFVSAMYGCVNFKQINPIFTFILHVKLPSFWRQYHRLFPGIWCRGWIHLDIMTGGTDYKTVWKWIQNLFLFQPRLNLCVYDDPPVRWCDLKWTYEFFTKPSSPPIFMILFYFPLEVGTTSHELYHPLAKQCCTCSINMSTCFIHRY